MVTYVYLIRRKCDGKKFVTFGNFKIGAYRPSSLYEFAPASYPYRITTPYGCVYNISCDLKYDSQAYSVIWQEKCNYRIKYA